MALDLSALRGTLEEKSCDTNSSGSNVKKKVGHILEIGNSEVDIIDLFKNLEKIIKILKRNEAISNISKDDLFESLPETIKTLLYTIEDRITQNAKNLQLLQEITGKNPIRLLNLLFDGKIPENIGTINIKQDDYTVAMIFEKTDDIRAIFGKKSSSYLGVAGGIQDIDMSLGNFDPLEIRKFQLKLFLINHLIIINQEVISKSQMSETEIFIHERQHIINSLFCLDDKFRRDDIYERIKDEIIAGMNDDIYRTPESMKKWLLKKGGVYDFLNKDDMNYENNWLEFKSIVSYMIDNAFKIKEKDNTNFNIKLILVPGIHWGSIH